MSAERRSLRVRSYLRWPSYETKTAPSAPCRPFLASCARDVPRASAKKALGTSALTSSSVRTSVPCSWLGGSGYDGRTGRAFASPDL